MIRRWAALLVLMAAAGGATAQTAVTSELIHTRDADDFDATHVIAGYLPGYRSPQDQWGVAAGYDHYSQDGWSRDGERLLGRLRRLDAATGAGLAADAGVARAGSRTRFIADATWSARLTPGTGFELIGARDWVDTRPAIDDGITYTFYGASIDQALGERLTAIALLARQEFSDGNARNHVRGRLILALAPELGVTLQLRHRRYITEDTDVPRRYFNPARYDETQLVLALRRRLTSWPGWTVSGAAGAGRETVDNDEHNPTVTTELRLEGPLDNGWRVGLRAQYLRTSGGVSGTDYWYSALGATLTIPLP